MAVREMHYDTQANHSKTQQLNIQNTNIFVHESGEGMPVLFLHGSPDTHDMWLPAIEHIGDGVRSIAIDLPGFGQSTMPDDFSLSLDNMADFICELVTSLNIEDPVTLVTSDFGGHYGLAFTTKYPTMVCGVAISNTNFFRDYQWHFFAKLYRVPFIGELLVASASRDMMKKTLKGVSPALPDSYIDSSYDSGFGSSSVRKTILRMYRERSSKDFVKWDDKLQNILQEKPAIVLWGDKDPFITSDYAERWGKAEVHHFKEYSHWLPLEAPEAYAEVLGRWIESL
ncbi:MAG: alpha/beta hydrolase [Phototrophicaceae bacterium]